MTSTCSRRTWAMAAAVALCSTGLHASEYPDRPIRLVVPYSAGGPTDGLARKLAEGMQRRLKQPVIVDNKPGGGSILGVDHVAKSKADGYTILFATGAPFIINPALNSKLPYKVQNFAPVATLASYSMVLATGSGQPFSDLRSFVQYARSNPGAVSYGSAGAGTSNHLAGELLASAMGLKLVHVPYRGNAPAMTDVIAGTVTFMFDMPATTLQHVQAGRVKLLGSTSPSRNPLTPDVPTIQEAGLPSYDVTSWFGIFTPSGTPQKVVDTLNQVANETMAEPELGAWLRQTGYEFKAQTPAQLAARIENESKTWSQLIQKADIRVE